MNARTTRYLAGLAALLIFAAGCEKPPAPKPKPTPTSSASQASDLGAFLEGQPPATRSPQPTGTPASHPPTGVPTPPPPAGADDPTWDVPAEWTTVKPSSSLRRSQYTLPRVSGDSEDGELIVFYFGPNQGGNVATNLERWRGQFITADGQPLPEQEAKTDTFDANGMKVTLLDAFGRYVPGSMAGGPPGAPRDNYRMLAAMVETPRGPWFFKATGPKATMDKHADAIRGLLKSVRR